MSLRELRRHRQASCPRGPATLLGWAGCPACVSAQGFEGSGQPPTHCCWTAGPAASGRARASVTAAEARHVGGSRSAGRWAGSGACFLQACVSGRRQALARVELDTSSGALSLLPLGRPCPGSLVGAAPPGLGGGVPWGSRTRASVGRAPVCGNAGALPPRGHGQVASFPSVFLPLAAS